MKVVLEEGAKLPTLAHEIDAGYDLYSRTSAIVRPGDHAIFDTGVHIEIPVGWCIKIACKSGLNFNKDLITSGVIDPGYTGAIKVKLYNLGKLPVLIESGDKVAQALFVKTEHPTFEIVESLSPNTERGIGGFGSTGR